MRNARYLHSYESNLLVKGLLVRMNIVSLRKNQATMSAIEVSPVSAAIHTAASCISRGDIHGSGH